MPRGKGPAWSVPLGNGQLALAGETLFYFPDRSMEAHAPHEAMTRAQRRCAWADGFSPVSIPADVPWSSVREDVPAWSQVQHIFAAVAAADATLDRRHAGPVARWRA